MLSRRMQMVAVILLLLLMRPLWAQVDDGSITGIVRDPSGSVVPNAHIEIINTSTNGKNEFDTNTDGTYRALGLIPGVYRVRASAPGFSTGITDSVRINVQSVAKVDFTLTVGDVKQEVQISASSQLLETQQADVGALLRRECRVAGREADRSLVV